MNSEDNFLSLNYKDLDKFYNDNNNNFLEMNTMINQIFEWDKDREKKIWKEYRTDDEIISILKSNGIFLSDKELFYKKLIFFKKEDGKLTFYLSHGYCDYLSKLIWLITNLNQESELKDFPLKCYNSKYKPRCSHNINYIMLSPCQAKGFYEKAFISYYVLLPKLNDRKDKRLKNLTIYETCKYISRLGESGFNESDLINKAIFRGTENNEYRKDLFEIESKYIDAKKEDYVPFLDNMKYKYIIDLWGLNGHSGRKFFLLFTNRLLLFPMEDRNKQFFEVSNNPLVANVHYVEYSVEKLNEIPDIIKYYEDTPSEYSKIVNNLKDYVKTYLNQEKLEKTFREIIESY